MKQIEYRPPEPDEIPSFMASAMRGFGEGPETVAEEQDDFRKFLGRMWIVGAFDGSLVVGTLGVIDFETNVPGGKLQTGGVTLVTVPPTHRRRGILSEMMRRTLAERLERGDVIASLQASETPIYGRFGFGVAMQRDRFSIERDYARLATAASLPGSVRLISLSEARPILPAIAAAVGAMRPGWITRDDAGWDGRLRDHDWERHGRGELICVLYENAGSPQGYMLYRRAGEERRDVVVAEMAASTHMAGAALWDFCFGIDLVRTITAGTRPVDDPLPWMLADMRRLKMLRQDWMWTRILDVPRALASRTYASKGALAIRVEDGFLANAATTYMLEGGPDGASCRETTAEPNLAMTVADLSAIYFGGVKTSVLARSGRVEYGSDDALRTADVMFATNAAPWNIVDF